MKSKLMCEWARDDASCIILLYFLEWFFLFFFVERTQTKKDGKNWKFKFVWGTAFGTMIVKYNWWRIEMNKRKFNVFHFIAANFFFQHIVFLLIYQLKMKIIFSCPGMLLVVSSYNKIDSGIRFIITFQQIHSVVHKCVQHFRIEEVIVIVG